MANIAIDRKTIVVNLDLIGGVVLEKRKTLEVKKIIV